MPRNAIAAVEPEYVLAARDIASALSRLVDHDDSGEAG
jgi:hypothetical protein